MLFLQDLERNSDDTLDYSQLNRDFDRMGTMAGTMNSSADGRGTLPHVQGQLVWNIMISDLT